jgi:acyl-CoA reductase-like NAD-dependent aldehyde dehydrogenase
VLATDVEQLGHNPEHLLEEHFGPAVVLVRYRSQEELLKELAYLRAENAYLKKLDALIREKGAATRGKKPGPSKG